MCSAKEILEAHNCGLVVPQGDYTGLVKQLAYLAENGDIRRTFGENGARIARELFDPGRIVQQYEDLYWSLVKTQEVEKFENQRN